MSFDTLKACIIEHILPELKLEIFTAKDLQIGQCAKEPIYMIQAVANELVAEGTLDFTSKLDLQKHHASTR